MAHEPESSGFGEKASSPQSQMECLQINQDMEISHHEKSASDPELSRSMILTLLSESRYPVLREILKNLYQHDVSALRTSCHTLNRGLQTQYPSLVQSCQSMYWFRTHGPRKPPFRKIYGPSAKTLRTRCCAGPTWNGRVRRCEGPQHGLTANKAEQSIVHLGGMTYYGDMMRWGRKRRFTHRPDYWICEPCVNIGAEYLSNCQDQFLSSIHDFHLRMQSGGSFAPICKDCVETRLPSQMAVIGHAGGRIQCRCAKELRKTIKENWYCWDCACELLQRVFWVPLWERSMHLRRKNRQNRRINGKLACGSCERMCLKKGLLKDGNEGVLTNYFMCMRCEDLYLREKVVVLEGLRRNDVLIVLFFLVYLCALMKF